ncbi:hypothetical protein [uncultured Tenacibaculum sp.]|uniref:hypothetical protein n=1 Tax=uncultured Tenacibaculum sp. TaxID=174713 RepID=UPI0026313B21|nr:hypothetical protein [uncultured Tenacibaculum sp.]
MKKIIVLATLMLWIVSFADSGKAYRILAEFDLGEVKVTGYVYYYTYYEDHPKKDNLLSFLKRKNSFKKLKVYAKIKSLDYFDFSLLNSDLEVIVENIKAIKVTEIHEFIPDQKLVLLTKREYSLISEKNYIKESSDLGSLSYYENGEEIMVAKNGNIFFESEVENFRKELREELKEIGSSDTSEGEEYNKFINQKKKELLEKEIVLFTVYYAL